MELNTLEDVLEEQLEDLHSAERQIVDALPEMISAASSRELREAFETHLEETRMHVGRLDTIFTQLGLGSPSAHCKGMEGLLAEGSEIASADGDPIARDAAIIAAAQRVEHYEIAGDGTARTLADQLGHEEARDLLDETIGEEGKADKLLTKIATGGMFSKGVNQAAAGRSTT